LSEKSEAEKVLLSAAKSEEKEFTDPELKLIGKVIKDFAPEVAYIYNIREDKTEEQQIKTGYLHENRVMGVILKLYLEGKKKITTNGVEKEYLRYFKVIARSTISSYLNNLIAENILYKKKEGRKVSFYFSKDPPVGIKPSWFTRIFCIVPAYFHRAIFFSKLYLNVETVLRKDASDSGYTNKIDDDLILNFKHIIGLILLTIFKNRTSCCVRCQFGKKEIYKELEERITVAINDRTDVLPDELIENLIKKNSELPMFEGVNIREDMAKKYVIKEILMISELHKKDLDFQRRVSIPRKTLRLKQIKASEEQNTS
jgi:hypothetical protein